jgi:Ferritin-like domain
MFICNAYDVRAHPAETQDAKGRPSLTELTRATFLIRSAATAGTLAFGGAVTATASRAAAPRSDDDLASIRLLVASELLAIDFYTNALTTKQYEGLPTASSLTRALAHEHAHYGALAQVLTDAGQVPAVAADIDFSYPDGAYDSRGSIARLGVRLEAIFLGAALGAAVAVQGSDLRLLAGQIAASEAQHLSVFSALAGGSPVGPALPGALPLDTATAALSDFES